MIGPRPTGALTAWLTAGALALACIAYIKGCADGGRLGEATSAANINRKNEEAGDAAEKRRSDHRSCVDAGRVFDFVKGTCKR